MLDDLDHDDDWPFCECGVTLLDGEDQCSVCACAPHHRECPCDECAAYWKRIARESEVAAERARTQLVCSCGWTGQYIEQHREMEDGCVVVHRDATVREANRG